ncbi:MAG: hypothetical protein H5T78_09890 [Nocardia sp.]|nr:hypothetical protein [Nocardia sp.]
MGIWIGEPKLTAPETVTWKYLANRTQNSRAVGGRLYLTGERLLFEPTHIDALTGGRSWQTPLTSITAVGTQAPTGGMFSGGLRTRLRIDLRDGGTELFVVNKMDVPLAVLQRAIAESA